MLFCILSVTVMVSEGSLKNHAVTDAIYKMWSATVILGRTDCATVILHLVRSATFLIFTYNVTITSLLPKLKISGLKRKKYV